MLQAIFSGLCTGCIYGLVALSLTSAIYVADVIVFAIGEILMAGAFGYYICVGILRLPWMFGLAAGIVLGIGMAVLIEKGMVSPLLNKKASVIMIVVGTLAAGTILGQGTQLIVGSIGFNVPFVGGMNRIEIGDFLIPVQQIVVVSTTLLVTVGFWLLTTKSTLGMAFRATGFDSRMASLVGISTRRIVLLAFVIAGCCAGVAGGLAAPFVGVHPLMGFHFLVKGFISCILGGIGNPYGGVIAGIAVGVLSDLLTVMGFGWLREIFVFGLVLIVLVVRPTGLFGEKLRA